MESQKTELHTPLPAVTLPDVDGVDHDLPALAGNQPLLVVFACNPLPLRPLA